MHETDRESSEVEASCAVILDGKASPATARALAVSARQALAGSGDVIVQCAALESIDTRAVQILLALKRELGARARTLRMVDIPDSVARLLAATGLETLSGPPRGVGANDVAE
jgi:anti-anti-sigma factor